MKNIDNKGFDEGASLDYITSNLVGPVGLANNPGLECIKDILEDKSLKNFTEIGFGAGRCIDILLLICLIRNQSVLYIQVLNMPIKLKIV